MTVNGGVLQEIWGVLSSGSVAFCIPWWQMNNKARWTIVEGTGWKIDIKGGMWDFESHASFPSTMMSCRLFGLTWLLSTMTAVYYDYCLLWLLSTTVYLDHYLPWPLSTSASVYLLLGRLLGPPVLLLGKTFIFSVMMCRSIVSHAVYCIGITAWTNSMLVCSRFPMVGIQWSAPHSVTDDWIEYDPSGLSMGTQVALSGTDCVCDVSQWDMPGD